MSRRGAKPAPDLGGDASPYREGLFQTGSKEMKRRRISRTKLADRIKTPRASIDRLFTDNDSAVSLQLLERVALPLGRKLKIELA